MYVANNPLMYSDPTGHAAASVTVGDVTVGNAQINNGTTTGNLRDIVKGLGGTVTSTNKTGIYTVVIPNQDTGKDVVLTVNANNSTILDSNGNKIADTKLVNNNTQVSVRQLSTLAGVDNTISWWTTDDKKQTNVIVQPEMNNAPVQVTRAGDTVNINAYVNFTGDANQIMADTLVPRISTPGDTSPNGKTYAEVASQAIMDAWKGTFNIYGQKVNVKTNVYSNNYTPNNILQSVICSDKQKFLEIYIGAGASGHLSSLPGDFAMRSHEGMTVGGSILGNESILDWSISRSSSPIVIYDYERNSSTGKMESIGLNWFQQTAAHEFGHALGLGDAYNSGYRGGTWSGSMDGYYAPYTYNVSNNGTNYTEYVPNNDMMLEGAYHNYVSDNDMRMVLEAYSSGKAQLFPWGTKSWKNRINSTGDVRKK